MKVLIVGLGSIARKHIAALKKMQPDVLIYALRSAANAGIEEGITNIFNISAIADMQIDFAIISNPTAYHQQAIFDLIAFEIPLFIEKPVFDTVDVSNAEVLDKIEAANIPTYVACNLRFLECLAFAKSFIDNKQVNEVNSYCGSYLPDWRPGKNFREIYSANKEMGGGVHIDLIHEIDYVCWLFGAPQKSSSFKANNSSLKITAVDYANYLFQYPDFCVSIILNYYRRDPKRSLEIILDDGTLYINLLTNQVTFNGEVIFTSANTIADTYTTQMEFFVDQILQNGKTFNDINEAYEILKLCISGN